MCLGLQCPFTFNLSHANKLIRYVSFPAGVCVWQEEVSSDHHVCFSTLPAQLAQNTQFLGGNAWLISLVRFMVYGVFMVRRSSEVMHAKHVGLNGSFYLLL